MLLVKSYHTSSYLLPVSPDDVANCASIDAPCRQLDLGGGGVSYGVEGDVCV